MRLKKCKAKKASQRDESSDVYVTQKSMKHRKTDFFVVIFKQRIDNKHIK